MSACTTTYHGKRCNERTKQIYAAANKMVRRPKFGGETSDITMVQGACNTGVSASAGTHDAGAVDDCTAFNYKNRVRVFRLLGQGKWYRARIVGLWEPHCHGVNDHDSTASQGAKNQIVEYHNRGDGLRGSYPDAGYRMMVFPEFVVNGKVGTYYCTSPCGAYDQQTGKSTRRASMRVGDKFTVVAVTKVGSSLWLVNVDGLCATAGHFSMTKPVVAAPVKVNTNLRPMTYNLPDGDKLPNADARITAAAALINSGRPTFVMMQEIVGIFPTGKPSLHARAIDVALGAKWWVVQPTLPYNENYTWFDSTLLALVKQYPDVVLTSAGGGRHITRSVFKHKKTGFVFAVGNMHLVEDHGGIQYEESRQSQGVKAMQAMREVSGLHGSCSIIVGGDMNTIKPIKAFVDGKLKNLVYNAVATTNAQYASYANIRDDTPNLGGQIDQMYASSGFVHNGLTVLLGLGSNGTWPALRPSDHVPVIGSITTY